MKKLLNGTIVLMLLAISTVAFQVSCTKTADAQTGTVTHEWIDVYSHQYPTDSITTYDINTMRPVGTSLALASIPAGYTLPTDGKPKMYSTSSYIYIQVTVNNSSQAAILKYDRSGALIGSPLIVSSSNISNPY